MAKKKETEKKPKVDTTGIMGLVGSTSEQAISETLEINYMPYAMSVIVSRAIPEIDGFKPSHRKLLYTMYKMGLLTGGRTKSANIVGQTMRLNPHGGQLRCYHEGTGAAAHHVPQCAGVRQPGHRRWYGLQYLLFQSERDLRYHYRPDEESGA